MRLENIKAQIQHEMFNISQTRITPEFSKLLIVLSTAATFALGILVLEGIGLWYFSGSDHPNLKNPFDGIYFIVVSIFGETASPISTGSRIITLLALLQGLIIATYLISITALTLVTVLSLFFP